MNDDRVMGDSSLLNLNQILLNRPLYLHKGVDLLTGQAGIL
jgi:hypothetical protein